MLLVVIGPKWLDARDENGRRLDNPEDMVRREIIAAFEHKVRVVPVLVNAARIPVDELPAELAQLATCQDVRVNFRNSEYDLPALVERLKRVMDAPTPTTRSLLTIDVEGAAAVEQRRVVHAIFDEVMAGTGIPPDKIVTEDRGDGITAVIDAELLNLLDLGLDTLITALARHNLVAGAQDRLRLRIAVHRGLVHRDEHGWSGAELTQAFRLLDPPQVKHVLARADRAQCALVVSDSVYHELIVRGYGNLNANMYAKLDDPVSWIRVPGYPNPPVAAESVTGTADLAAGPATLPALPSLPAGISFGGHLFQGNAIGHVDASVRRDRETNQ